MERTRKTNRKSPRGNGTPCPRCGSTDTKKNGYNVVGGRRIPRRKCSTCMQPFDHRTGKAKPRCECGVLLSECDGHTNWFGERPEILRTTRISGYSLNLHNWRA